MRIRHTDREWPRTHCFRLLIDEMEGYIDRKNTFSGIACVDEALDCPDDFFGDSTFYFVQYSRSAKMRSRMRNIGISGLCLYKKYKSFDNIVHHPDWDDYRDGASKLFHEYHYNDSFSELITGN